MKQWCDTVDRLLAAFAHNANGRTVSLEGLVVLIDSGAPVELWLPLLRDEAQRLARHSGGLHAIAPDLGAEPLDPRDLLALATRTLDALHITLLPPVLNQGAALAIHSSRTAYVRALVMTVLGALPERAEAVVHSRLERRDGRVVLRLSPERPWQPPPLADARALLAPYAGTLEVSPESLELTLPALD